jgi:hypothetical protein
MCRLPSDSGGLRPPPFGRPLLPGNLEKRTTMRPAVFIGLIALLLAMPDGIAAQAPASAAELRGLARLRITPHVGWAPEARRTEIRRIADPARPGEVTFGEFEVDLGAGVGAGADIEYRLGAVFSVYGGGAFVTRGRSAEFNDLAATSRSEQGSRFVMARAGIALRLPESESLLQLRRLEASVFGGPTLIRELPRADPVRTHAEPMSLRGVQVGLGAELPLGDGRYALHAAIEDHIVWWDHAELGARAASVTGEAIAVVPTVGASHLFLFRVGLTTRAR